MFDFTPPHILIALFLAVVLLRAFNFRPHRRLRWGQKMSASFIASPEFLQTPDWQRVRYLALKANDGRCELCGRSKHDGVVLNVDHIKPRAKFPKLALDARNCQVLCGGERVDHDGRTTGGCNLGKGNIDETDWRAPDHPHRER